MLQPDPSAPLVSVNLWYHVGSKDEKPGKTGFAHLFEHMLFQGSEHVGNRHFALIQERGGTANGSTSFDRTNYYETLPSGELELALWLEADRMGFLLGGLDQAKLDNQREVVKNERRFRMDNQPYGSWMEKGFELLFPPAHPYHWPIIGYMEDLERATLEDVSEFFRKYYLPNNAVLSVVGDLEAGPARDLIERYFAPIPRGAEVPRVDARHVPLPRQRALTVEDQVPLTRLFLLYAVPPVGSREHYALDFASDLLASGKSSRLYRALVHDRELCKEVSAGTLGTEEAGVLVVTATVRPEAAVAEVEEALDRELSRLGREAAGEGEMRRTLNRVETAFVTRLESAEARADLLSMYTTTFDDPRQIEREIERYRSLTAEAVSEAAAAALSPERRVLLRYVPKTEAPAAVVAGSPLDRRQVPRTARERAFAFPRPLRATLDNGLRVVLAPFSKVPSFSAAALIDAGSCRDPPGSEGMASLTTALFDEGTERLGSIELAEALDSLGAGLLSSAEVDCGSLQLVALARNFIPAFDLLAEVLTASSFPEREFARLKQEVLAQVLEDRAHPESLADDVFEQLLYGDHPYAHPVNGREDSLTGITRDAARAFSEAHIGADATTLLVVGDLEPERVLALVRERLGGWARAGSARAPLPEPTQPGRPAGRRIYLVDRPGSTQSELRLGNLALARGGEDWVAAEVMNAIFGGKFTSRINLNLREKHGYTYGARSSFAGRRAVGPWVISTAVENRATAPALRELYAEIDRLREEPVSEGELRETLSYLRGLFPLTVETSSDLLDRLSEIELYQLPDDWFDRYPDRLMAVGREDVLRVARAYVGPPEMVVLVVGDAAAVGAGLEALGPVTRLNERGEEL